MPGGYGFGKSGLLNRPYSFPKVFENTKHSQPETKISTCLEMGERTIMEVKIYLHNF